MSKFSGASATTKPTVRKFATGPTKTKGSAPVGRTFEGGPGYQKGDKTALFTLAVTNMVGEPTFYESGPGRDNRFLELVRTVTAKDPEWVAGFIPFLRDTANMRSASIVVAAEAARTINEMRAQGAEVSVSARHLINSACSRADEPAEVLGYWLANYGRQIPMGVKRGIADAANKLYNERSALKYDGGERGVRMGDVIELTHPKPVAPWQSALFGHLLDRRHNHVEAVPEALSTIMANEALKNVPTDQRRALLKERGNEALAEAGYTWEILSGWLPGGMDAEAWAAIIPSMGYMALLRNLRNFEEKGVDRKVLAAVRDKLSDPEQVARSRQFPYRFWSAYKNSGSTFFASAIEDALDLSCKNIPEFKGRTLIAIDTSGSMRSPVSGRSDIKCVEVGALFGAALASRQGVKNVQTIIYGDRWAPIETKVSVLRSTEDIDRRVGSVGHGTQTWPSVAAALKAHGPFDRVCVFTDMQDAPNRATIPANIPVYVWDLMGYGKANIDTSTPGRYLLGGFSDAAFKLVPLLEAGVNAAWPWME